MEGTRALGATHGAHGGITPHPAPFIVGVPRSGTTLLRLQLDAHPLLSIPPETGFGHVLAETGVLGAGAPAALDAMTELPTWPDLGIEGDELATLRSALHGRPAADAPRAVYASYAARHGKQRWGDKTPDHLAQMNELSHALPEVRFIHIIRDGRDVAASLRGLPFAPGDGSIEAIAAAWSDGIARAQWVGETLPHYREVRYERLVTEPELVLRDLCDYLELDYESAMSRAHEGARSRLAEPTSARIDDDGRVRFANGTSVLARSVRPPDPSRIGRWRSALTADEARRFEAIAGDRLVALGYETATAPRPRPRLRTRRFSPAESAGRDGSLRVVFAMHRFAATGGTESYSFTVARELLRLGHEPVIAAEDLGPMADVAERHGIPVARSPAELPAACDVVFAHDAIGAAALGARYPGARLVYFGHSDLFDHQLPPIPVSLAIAASDRVAARLSALGSAPRVERLTHPIDPERFAPSDEIAARPRRALLLSNYLDGERRRALVDAWEAAGVECVQIGAPATTVVDVVPEINAADIVVAKGRAALEAMSCARAVYVYDEFGGDGWVTTATYPGLEADNFAGQASPNPRTPVDLAADLDLYRPEMGWINRELVRTHHGARKHAIKLVELLRDAGPRGSLGAREMNEVARLARLNLHSESQAGRWRDRAAAAERRAEDAAAQRARTEAELQTTRRLLDTRRVRIALAAGRILDRLTRRR